MTKDFSIKIIKFLAALALLIPLVVSGKFYFPFIFPKVWIFQMIVELMLFFYILLVLADSEYRPRWNLASGVIAILTFILIITSFTGVDYFRSFWGNTERMSGVIAWFHLFAYALVISAVLKGKKDWHQLFIVSIFVSIIEFFYALLQYAGSSLVWFATAGDRAIGTIGNSDLIGIYAIFNTFFSLYLWKGSENKNWAKFYLVSFFLNIGTVFLSASRGALIGLVLGLLFYLVLQSYFDSKWRKISVVALSIILVFLGLLWIGRNSNFVKNHIQLTRIVNASLKDDTVQQRFTEWGIAWDAFLASPIVGWGPNNYLYLHNKFLNPRVYLLRETNFDRAHNTYLDYASMSGIAGLLGFIAFIALLFWIFFKQKFWTLAALMVAYAGVSFFAFDSPASFATLFFTVGFAIYIRELQLGHARNVPETAQKSNLSPKTLAFIFLVILPLMIYIFWQVSMKPALANYRFTIAFLGAKSQEISSQQAFDYYKQALEPETLGTTEFRSQYVNWLNDVIGRFPSDKKLEVIDYGLNQLETEGRDHPLVFTYLYLGQLYYFKSQGAIDPQTKKELTDKAARAFDRALELAPKRHEIYYAYLQMAIANKDYQKGIELTKKLVEINPAYSQNWWYLGLAYEAVGDDQNAIKYIDQAMTIWYHDDKDQSLIKIENGGLVYNLKTILDSGIAFNRQKSEILGAVNPFIKAKRWPDLLLLYLAMNNIDPSDPKVHESLASVYQNLGLPNFAEKETSIANQLKAQGQ